MKEIVEGDKFGGVRWGTTDGRQKVGQLYQ